MRVGIRHRSLQALLSGASLAGCTITPANDPTTLRVGQERACAIVVAGHVGMAVEQVTPAWQGIDPEGNAVVMVEAPGRPHTCEVDPELRVHALRHPGAE